MVVLPAPRRPSSATTRGAGVVAIGREEIGGGDVEGAGEVREAADGDVAAPASTSIRKRQREPAASASARSVSRRCLAEQPGAPGERREDVGRRRHVQYTALTSESCAL